MLGEAADVVQLGLDRVELNTGSARVAEDVAVVDHGEPRVVGAEPARHLLVGDQVDVPHPGGVHLHRAQRVAQLVAAERSGAACALRVCSPVGPARARRAAAPRGVGAVDPGVDGVDRFANSNTSGAA